MTSHSVATALTLYRSNTVTLEQAATAGGCSPDQLRTSARTFGVSDGTSVEPPN